MKAFESRDPRAIPGLCLSCSWLKRWEDRDVEAPVREGVSEPSGPGPSQTLFLKAEMEWPDSLAGSASFG